MIQLGTLISNSSLFVFFPNHRNVPNTCLGEETVKIRESTFENNEISPFLSLAYQVQPIPEKKNVKLINILDVKLLSLPLDSEYKARRVSF